MGRSFLENPQTGAEATNEPGLFDTRQSLDDITRDSQPLANEKPTCRKSKAGNQQPPVQSATPAKSSGLPHHAGHRERLRRRLLSSGGEN